MKAALNLLDQQGPLSGKEFMIATGLDTFQAWKFCAGSEEIITRIIGRRYLRLDQKVEGYARLSPSIMREFLNYTVVGLVKSQAAIEAQAKRLEKEIAAISKKKINLARETIQRLFENHPERDHIVNQTSFIIAGDVVFGMAHAEPRPEASTGELVKGSDLDIIVIADDLPVQILEDLDALIYREKYNLLMNPVSKEELDYIVKDLQTVEKQLQFTDFKAMVASKILHEGQFLYGSERIYGLVKQRLIDNAIPQKIQMLEETARLNRSAAASALLGADASVDHDELMALFYTTEEKEEIF
jgi:hypothetical protein